MLCARLLENASTQMLCEAVRVQAKPFVMELAPYVTAPKRVTDAMKGGGDDLWWTATIR